MKEIWKNIKGYEGLYQISNLGRVKSFRRKNKVILKLREDKDSYLLVNLYKDRKQRTFKVHRLVAQAFLDDKNNLPEVNHRDENKVNNCLENLEWCTHVYNNNYGTKNRVRSKRVKQFDLNGKYIKTYNSMRQACKELNISDNIGLCCQKKTKSCGGFYWEYAS